MEAVVRFYWRGGEETLSFDALPEADRNPLQIRLNVLREHVPAALHQFEQGRYVAAAWPSAGQIILILCHPNINHGPADAVCLNTRELPQVVLRLRNWDEAPGVARVLLAAFGAEASGEQECVRARYALRDWLREREQGAMAAVVMRYFTFPLGVRAAAAGRKPAEPHLGPVSRVGPGAATAMMAFVEAADGQWPLPEALEPAWRQFVVKVYRDNVAFDPDELTRWFAASGWDTHAAVELTRRLSADAALLDEYDDEGRRPA
jgi:hypothetical protein